MLGAELGGVVDGARTYSHSHSIGLRELGIELLYILPLGVHVGVLKDDGLLHLQACLAQQSIHPLACYGPRSAMSHYHSLLVRELALEYSGDPIEHLASYLQGAGLCGVA